MGINVKIEAYVSMKHKAGVAAIAPSPSPIFVFLSYIAERPIPPPNFLKVALVKYLLKGEERVRDDGMLIIRKGQR